jgi:hypothetical protein
MTSFNFLSWSTPDRVRNWFRGKHRFARPRVRRIRRNLREGLDAGAVIIFAHCGLPYWAPYGWLGKWLEHTDRTAVRRFLRNPAYRGKAFADVSAILTPFRHSYFSKLRKLPEGSLVMGSDFPVPIFTLPMDLAQDLKDLEEVLTGHMKDIVPKGNLIDVNYRELQTVFGKGHPMFTKFASLK